jgi:hypothetical protein
MTVAANRKFAALMVAHYCGSCESDGCEEVGSLAKYNVISLSNNIILSSV